MLRNSRDNKTILYIKLGLTWRDRSALKDLVLTNFFTFLPYIFNRIQFQTVSWSCHWVYMPFLKKTFNVFCSVAICIIMHYPYHILEREKCPKCLCSLSIDCWGNDWHFPCSFTWHASSYHKLSGELWFLSGVVLMKHKENRSSITSLYIADWWFITEYHFYAIIDTPSLFSPV